MKRRKQGRVCPHKSEIRFCPLYVASHCATLVQLSCVDRMDESKCGADWDRDFDERLARLRAASPEFVEEREDAFERHERSMQRARNMRLLRLH